MSQSSDNTSTPSTSVATLPRRALSRQREARIAFVHATWHADIVNQARDSFLAELARNGIGPQAVTVPETSIPGISAGEPGGAG